MMSKPILMTLPFVLLLLDYWPLQRLSLAEHDIADGTSKSFLKIPYKGISIQRLVLEKVPFLAITCSSFITTLIMFRNHTAIADLNVISLGLRVSNALVSYVKYLKKLFLPYDLSLMYPYPSSIPLWEVVGAVLILLGISIIAIRLARSMPYLITGWLWFLGSLMPFLGIVQGGLWPEMADRYAYITSIGILQAVIWGVPHLTARWSISTKIYAALMPCLIFSCMAITWHQVGYWKNSIKLFQRVVTATIDNYVAHNILGFEFSKRGDYTSAIDQIHEAIRINPNYAPAYFNLGVAYLGLNNIPEAINAYTRAIQIDPQYVDAHINLGLLLSGEGRADDAIKHFMEALKMRSTSVEARNNLANIFLTKGKIDSAIYHYQKALEYDSQNIDIRNNLGAALYGLGRYDEAEEEFNKTLLLKPQHEGALKGIKLARERKREINGAMVHLNEVLRDEPDNFTVCYKLAELYRARGRTNEAIDHYEKALLINPESEQTLHNLAILYAAEEDFERALSSLQKMRGLNPDDPDVYYNIACIYSRQGKIDEAVENLSGAINRGFDNQDALMTDTDLKNVRETEYYRSIISGGNN